MKYITRFIAHLLLIVICTQAAHGGELEILNDEVVSLYQKGEYTRATKVAKKALHIAEETLGKNHPDVALSLNNLARLYYGQGDYEAALPLYRRSLQINEETPGIIQPRCSDIAKEFVGAV